MKNNIDIFFTKNELKIKGLIKKIISDKDMNGSMFSNVYLYIIEKSDSISTDAEIMSYISNYLKIQKYWNKTDYLKEKSIFRGDVCDDTNMRREGVITLNIDDINVFDNEETEYNDEIDKEIDDLEKRLEGLSIEYRTLFDIIFKDGIASNFEISKILKCSPSQVSPLKKILKEKLGIRTDIYWNTKKIKKIWK